MLKRDSVFAGDAAAVENELGAFFAYAKTFIAAATAELRPVRLEVGNLRGG